MNKKKILFVITISFIIVGIVSYNFHQFFFGEIIKENKIIYIYSEDSIEDVKKGLTEFIKDEDVFTWLAEKKKYTKPKAGKYLLKKGMSLNDVINLLRSGKQIPVQLSFNNQNTLENLAGRISYQIEADSVSLIEAFTNRKYLSKENITRAQMLGYFIPNTYEFFWNTSAQKFIDRMMNEYNQFWNSSRLEKAKALKMSPSQIITLASIVQKETPKAIEQPRVAGLYLNRIKKGIPLQADPTIIYILKQKYGQDFTVKRVLFKDLKIKSPYNTYLHKGVPPSLIAMPDISAIDAVLDYEKHNYLYMCVDVEKFGYHTFASSMRQHQINARKYHLWLNKQGINR